MNCAAGHRASSTTPTRVRWCCRRCRSTRAPASSFQRGNYCGRGARFGVHSTEENFANPFYGKLTALAYFNGGLRIWDIREPQAPREVAFYVPEANAQDDPDGYMTNNVEIDNRGYIYIVDRNGAGWTSSSSRAARSDRRQGQELRRPRQQQRGRGKGKGGDDD